jgi:hypothetical protein
LRHGDNGPVAAVEKKHRCCIAPFENQPALVGAHFAVVPPMRNGELIDLENIIEQTFLPADFHIAIPTFYPPQRTCNLT